MIKSKKINILVAVTICFALAVSLALVALSGNRELVHSLKKQPEYVTRVFGEDVITIEILADETDWQTMLDNATAEEFIMADVVVNGTKFTNVGIRPKGNSSLAQVASSNSDRYSFRITFDKYIEGQTCFGLQSLVVNNMLGDYTYMKEYVSYDMMAQAGVDAPCFGFSNISVNGQNWGLYLAVELYNDSYEQRVFGDTSGMLYNVKSMDMGGGGNFSVNPDIQGGAFPQVGGRPSWQEGAAAPSADGEVTPPAEDSAAPPVEGSAAPPVEGGAGTIAPPEGIGDKTAPPNGQTPQRPDGGTPNQTPPGDGQMPPSTEGENEQSPESDQNTGFGGGMNFGGMGGMNFGGMGGRGNSSGGTLAYNGDDVSAYSAIFNNVVGKGTDSDYERVVTALKALSEGKDLETYLDVDAILRYLAAHTVSVNLDSYSSSMAQNYYLYERDGQLTMLPWDYNLAWGGFQSGDAGTVINFPIDTPVSEVELSARPMIAKLFENEEYLARYHSYLQALMDEYFADGKFEAKIDELDAIISTYVQNDPTAFCTYEQYQAAVETFKTLGNLRAESIQGQLDGTVPSTTEGQTQNPEALIDAAGISLSTLGSMGGGMRQGGFDRDGTDTEGAQGGRMPGMFGGAELPDFETLAKAMEIVQAAGGTITDEAKEQLLALGITEEQLTLFTQMGERMGNMQFGAFGAFGRGGTDGTPPETQPAQGGAQQGITQGQGGGRNTQNGNQPAVPNTSRTGGYGMQQWILIGVLAVVLVGAIVFVANYRRRY